MTDRDDILNCVVTGQVRCGAAVVQSSVHSHPDATCHPDLLHADEKTRQANHECYFGKRRDPEEPNSYFGSSCEVSAEQYLNTVVLDNPCHGERVIGVKVLYPELHKHQLWEFLHERGNVGGFCCIHIYRNPVACFVSLCQARQSGVWHQDVNDRGTYDCPPPVDVSLRDLTRFVDWQLANETRLRAACEDRLEITYKELFLNYREVMDGVFDFLELSSFADVSAGFRRLKNRNMNDRIINLAALKREATGDVLALLEGDDLF